MKKILLLILAITGLHFQSFAQNGQTHFTGGLFLGVNGTQIDGDKMSGFDKSGVATGGYINFTINRFWNVQMEFLYSQKGSKAPTNVDSGTVLNVNNLVDSSVPWRVLRLNYFEVPLMVQYNITKRVYASAGLSFGYLVGIYREDYPSGQNSQDINFIKKTEYSANAGIGYFLTPHLTAYLRYSQSILPINTPNPNANYGSATSNLYYAYLTQGLYNIVFTAGFYYNFTPKFKWPPSNNKDQMIGI